AAPRTGPVGRRRRRRGVRPRGSPARLVVVLVAAVGVPAALVLAGPAAAPAAAMLGGTGYLLGRRLVAERRRRRALPEVLRGLRALTRELRAGADPVTAVDGAARAGHGAGAEVLGRLLVVMRAGSGAGPVDATAEGGPAGRVLDALCSGWVLSREHGVAFGRVVSGIADQLSDEVAAEQERMSQLAGPRMSGYVMAGLPLMGLLLGAGMGVDPVQVLTGSEAGRLLLLVGVALMCGGLLWSARIVGR
uniref:type II secretion system F family protein n=1 Tax=Nakamurella sp. TaxID=1869182 RepID=UPI003B3BC391